MANFTGNGGGGYLVGICVRLGRNRRNLTVRVDVTFVEWHLATGEKQQSTSSTMKFKFDIEEINFQFYSEIVTFLLK